MIFPKKFISDEFEKKLDRILFKIHPFETTNELASDKSPFALYLLNYLTAFDLKSDELKRKMVQARKEIVENCYGENVMDIYPNEKKIEQCIKNTELKYLGSAYNQRNIFFGNILQHMKETVDELPISNGDINREGHYNAVDKFIWDSFKGKYYFKEKY